MKSMIYQFSWSFTNLYIFRQASNSFQNGEPNNVDHALASTADLVEPTAPTVNMVCFGVSCVIIHSFSCSFTNLFIFSQDLNVFLNERSNNVDHALPSTANLVQPAASAPPVNMVCIGVSCVQIHAFSCSSAKFFPQAGSTSYAELVQPTASTPPVNMVCVV